MTQRYGLCVFNFLCMAPAALQAQADKSPLVAREGPVLDWERTYWRYHLALRPPRYSTPLKNLKGVVNFVSYERGWHINPMLGRVTSPDAPVNWMKADFDDAQWPRQRRPEAGSEGWSYDPVVQVKHLRGTFAVSEPTKVAGLIRRHRSIGLRSQKTNKQELVLTCQQADRIEAFDHRGSTRAFPETPGGHQCVDH